MNSFYRALYSHDHDCDWSAGVRNSYHHWTNGDWSKRWDVTKSTAVDDYPLITSGGTYTASARDHFVATARKYGKVQDWTAEEIKAAGELAGLCAFTTPGALARWCEEIRQPVVLVEFSGKYVCDAPDGDGAVVAAFIAETRRWQSLQEYKSAFAL